MGIWNKDLMDNEVLPIPKDKYQRFVHLCDYLSSKRFMILLMLFLSMLILQRRGKIILVFVLFMMYHSPSMSVSPEKQIYTCFSLRC